MKGAVLHTNNRIVAPELIHDFFLAVNIIRPISIYDEPVFVYPAFEINGLPPYP